MGCLEFTAQLFYQTMKKQIRVFSSVVAVVFQIIFHAEMHTNDIFYFLKIIFDINTSKRSKTYQILAKEKFLNFFKMRFASRSQT